MYFFFLVIYTVAGYERKRPTLEIAQGGMGKWKANAKVHYSYLNTHYVVQSDSCGFQEQSPGSCTIYLDPKKNNSCNVPIMRNCFYERIFIIWPIETGFKFVKACSNEPCGYNWLSAQCWCWLVHCSGPTSRGLNCYQRYPTVSHILGKCLYCFSFLGTNQISSRTWPRVDRILRSRIVSHQLYTIDNRVGGVNKNSC